MQLTDEVTRSGRFPCARGRVTPNKYCWNEPGASVEAIQMPTDSAEVDHLILLHGGHERWVCGQSLRFRSSSLSHHRQVTGPPGTSCPLDPEAAPCVSSHSCWSGPPEIRPQLTSRKVLARVLLWVHSLCTRACWGQRQGSSQGTSSRSPAGPSSSDPPIPAHLP